MRPTVISSTPRVIGRYLLCDAIASGGMATVHLSRLMGPEGFSRTVAIKQLHPQFARDPEFVAMFLDEARLASRVRHPNVVSPLDVISMPPELFIVMDYVHGEPLSRLLKRGTREPVPARIASAIVSQALLGLHAAHEATGEDGEPLRLVHRDVSPHNVLVSQDGVARVVDFGIAKATTSAHHTERGKLKGKLGYMAPEQVNLESVDRRADVFAVGVVLWELLTGQRLFCADNPAAAVQLLLHAEIEAPSRVVPGLPADIDEVVLHALSRDVNERFMTARAMAQALDSAVPPSSMLEVAKWVEARAGAELSARAELLSEVESLRFDDFTQAMSQRSGRAQIQVFAAMDGDVSKDSVGPAEVSIALAHRRGPWRKGWFVPVVALLALAILFVWVRAQPRNLAPAAAAPMVNGAAPAPAPVVQAESAQHSSLAAGDATLPGLDAGERAPPESAASEHTPPGSVKAASSPSTRSRAPAFCDVPYVIDKSGVKRFKEACF